MEAILNILVLGMAVVVGGIIIWWVKMWRKIERIQNEIKEDLEKW